MTDLHGLAALVTGAGGGGGGTAIARQLQAGGARVTANVRSLAALPAQVRADLDGIAIVEGDLADEQAAQQLVDAATVHGRLDIVVHNAAPALPWLPIDELSTEQWRAEFGVIVDAAFFLSRSVAPLMRAAGFGRIILISSNAAVRGARGRSAAYPAAKAALHGLAAQLALELGPYGGTANVVAPSQLDTPRVRRAGRRTDASLAGYARGVPVGRVGEPADLAALVAFLAGRDSGYLTGQVIGLDGGSSLSAPATLPTSMTTNTR